MPRDEDGSMSFEDAMKAALEADSDEPEVDLGAEFVDPSEDVEPVQAEAATVEPAPEVEAAPTEEPVPSKSLARIMERETKLLERETKLTEAQPQLEELKQRVESFEQAQRSFTNNPTEFIKSLSPDTDLKRLAESLWYESQGQEAPKAYLEKKAATQQNKELVERLAKIEEGEQNRQRQAQEQAAQNTVAQYQGSLQAFAETAPAETFPLMSAMQSKNPDWVAGTMLEIARGHARQTQGQVLTPDQAAAALEKHIASFQVSQPQTPQVTPPATPQGTSLRNTSTQTQPDREPVDELSDEFLRRKAYVAIGLDPDLA
jgi:hypothetical protein